MSTRRTRLIAPLFFLTVAGVFGAIGFFVPAREASAQVLSPGPLGKCHQDLEGDQNCTKCHTSGKQIDNKLCLDCHKDLNARIEAKKGYHASKGVIDKPCGPCHIDHIGRNARIVRWSDEGGDRNKFDHAKAGWVLTGKHAAVECLKCHNTKSKADLETFLGLSTACSTCHKDPHEGRFGTSCEKCHDTTDWKKVEMGPGGFDHNKTKFPLKGLHAKVACKECHGGEPPKYTGLSFELCSDCHKDPHQGRFPGACSSCHTEKGWHETSMGKGGHPVLSLANGHAKVACAKCHDKGNDKDPSKGKTCVACHPNVHLAAFGNDCKKCHAEILWLGIPRSISLEAHAITPYPLRAKHVAVACEKCHDPKKPAKARFRELQFERCNRCHADKHAGEFNSRAFGECAPCHVEEGFAPSIFGLNMHGTTKFPLDAKHRAVPCSGCHAAVSPRLDWRNPKKLCADCHANPHGDQFAAEMAKGGCGGCHTAVGWGQAKFDHSTFPLLGAHVRTACTGCHDASAEDRKSGKGATFKGVPRECEGCHADEHAGQFQVAPAKKCGDCHGDETWKISEFDHTKTAFALDGKHAPLACEKCHAKERRPGGLMKARYRLGFTKCRDCHPDPHR